MAIILSLVVWMRKAGHVDWACMTQPYQQEVAIRTSQVQIVQLDWLDRVQGPWFIHALFGPQPLGGALSPTSSPGFQQFGGLELFYTVYLLRLMSRDLISNSMTLKPRMCVHTWSVFQFIQFRDCERGGKVHYCCRLKEIHHEQVVRLTIKPYQHLYNMPQSPMLIHDRFGMFDNNECRVCVR